MIGERLKQARLAAGFTLEEVVARLPSSLTKAGLSKYEQGKTSPPSSLLAELAAVLGVAPAFFFQRAPQIQWGEFRKRSTLTSTQLNRIKAWVTTEVENRLWLEDALCIERKHAIQRSFANSFKMVEDKAVELRESWGLGTGPIESLSQVLEDQGLYIVRFVDATGKMDGMSASIGPGRVPLILVSKPEVARNEDVARYRLTAAHELGHLVLETGYAEGSKQNEDLAYRFAGALLVPEKTAFRELGKTRRSLQLPELALLKDKYGISIQAWLRRALDLGIIDRGHYESWCRHISMRGWRKQEPVKYVNPREKPTRLRQLTLRALSERLITPDRARELCPEISTDLDTLIK